MIPLEKAKSDFEEILIHPPFSFFSLGKGKQKLNGSAYGFSALHQLKRASLLSTWAALWFLLSITGSGSRRKHMVKINPPICIQ